jgi:NAD(P)-dependent dehydrogenase (short-subunit alcohol dehydrogenase family)
VTLACRNPSKAKAAAADIRAITGNDAIDCKTLDLASFQSIHDFAEGWGDASSRPIDALINNAGVMAVYPQQFTKDGFELTFGVNHLGHFLLTCLLENPLRAGSVDGRCINNSKDACDSQLNSFTHLRAQLVIRDRGSRCVFRVYV